MSIQYKDIHDFEKSELERFFLSVGWSSGHYPDKPVVLISSDYHMDRAVQTAEAAGFSDILRLPAPSSFMNYGANVLSEVILELVELMPGQ